MFIALCQLDMAYEDIETNKVKAEQYCKEASNTARMIFFSEMTFTGFTMHQIIDESIHSFMQELSVQYHIIIGYGYIKEGYYNAFRIIDGTKILADYKKVHPFLEESNYYQKGNELVTCKVDDYTIGLSICYDLRFPVMYSLLARTCDIIVNIASWPKVRDEHWLTLLKARAIENQCYILGINRTGRAQALEYIGHSIGYDGWGNALNKLYEDERNIMVDIEHIKYPSNFVKDQRWKLYKDWLQKGRS